MVSLTWNTATEWDNAQSESGVVHESVSNTDHNDATIVKQGYQIASPSPSSNLLHYYPFHEDSGSTANDFSGNNNDASISGCTLGVTAPLGTTGYSFDGNNDFVDLGSVSLSDSNDDPFTLHLWAKKDNTGSGQVMIAADGRRISVSYESLASNGYEFSIYDGSNRHTVTSGNTVTGTWQMHTATWDGSTMEYFLNASSQGTSSPNGYAFTNNSWEYGREPDSADAATFGGDMWEARIYKQALTSSEIQTLYDVVDTAGTHTTSVKTS